MQNAKTARGTAQHIAHTINQQTRALHMAQQELAEAKLAAVVYATQAGWVDCFTLNITKFNRLAQAEE